jgi:hypothetical protein
MTAPKNSHFPFIVEEALTICPCNKNGVQFGPGGIAYSVMMLEHARKDFRKTRNVEKFASYADVVTHAFFDWLANITPTDFTPQQKREMNATSLANVAFISLYASKPEMRKKFTDCLAQLY